MRAIANRRNIAMGKLAFYRQARIDGGMRTGVDYDDTPLLHEFAPGSDDNDPALVWYVDIEFEGDSLPSSADDVRRWLVRHARAVAESLRVVADELVAGIDVAVWPLKRSLGDLPRSVHATLSCSAMRRIDSREIGRRLRELADEWRQIIRGLPAMQEAA
jgi:hypothetical protein